MNRIIFFTIITIVMFYCADSFIMRREGTLYGHPHNGGSFDKIHRGFYTRNIRSGWRHPITIIDSVKDCFMVTADEGDYYFKSEYGNNVVCGIYIISKPDHRIEVSFNFVDFTCRNGGLIAWLDGWELNGSIWPSESDNISNEQIGEWCGDRKPEHIMKSSQNAALVQYRTPKELPSTFSISIRHVPLYKPCNVLVYGANGTYSLSNYGMTRNCSLLVLGPSSVNVVDINIGLVIHTRFGIEGVMHQCGRRGLKDFVEIGGSNGLGAVNMYIADNVCGNSDIPDTKSYNIVCENTVLRLVSGGAYYNSVTFVILPLPQENMITAADLICPINQPQVII